jgi:2-keto-myo-inositol isomerase
MGVKIMKIALNGATTMHADLETDIRAASEAGYDFIEIWAAKLREYLKHNTVENLDALIKKHGIKPYSINSIEHITFRSPDEYESIKGECKELTGIAGALDCPYVVVVPGKLPDALNQSEILDESVKVLNELADIASENDVSLAFEFLGQMDCSVQTLDFCAEIVKACGRDDVGLVLDSFHFYAGHSTFEALQALDPAKLFIFHINDAEDLPHEQLTDAHRLYPGEGILPLKELKLAFDQIGYNEMVSIEIFRPEYWVQDPYSVARKAIESTREVLGIEDRAARA